MRTTRNWKICNTRASRAPEALLSTRLDGRVFWRTCNVARAEDDILDMRDITEAVEALVANRRYLAAVKAERRARVWLIILLTAFVACALAAVLV
jgi:hypothetical protein